MLTVFGVSASIENVGVMMIVLIFNTPFVHPYDKFNAKENRINDYFSIFNKTTYGFQPHLVLGKQVLTIQIFKLGI